MKPYHVLYFKTEKEYEDKARELESTGYQVHRWDISEMCDKKGAYALQVRDARLKGTKWPKMEMV